MGYTVVMIKNRADTEQLILDTVTDLVRENGFAALGVNAVARKAGVSKVLIYRYFGNYQGLLETWALRRNFWISGSERARASIAASAEHPGDIAAALKGLVRAQIDALRADRVSREILRWFIAEKDAVASRVMARVEEQGRLLLAEAERAAGTDFDLGALSALIIAGLYYLALLADRANDFNGIDLSTDRGWNRILGSIDALIDQSLGPVAES